MSAQHRNGRKQLDRLADALFEDYQAMSDDEIREELGQDDVDQATAQFDKLFEQADLAVRKSRLRAAKDAVRAQGEPRADKTTVVSLEHARKRLASLQRQGTDTQVGLMLAARKGTSSIQDMSDNDVQSLIEDLLELGLWQSDENE